MKSTFLDQLFHVLSKFVIIVPVLIILFVLVTKGAGVLNLHSVQKKEVPTPSPSSSPNVPLLSPTVVSSEKISLSLSGPLVCHYDSSTATVSAKIKNKKIAAELQKEKQVDNVVVNGDCLYHWKKGTIVGEKICGISSMLSIVDMLSSSGLMDPKSIVGLMGGGSQIQGIDADTFSSENISRMCHKEDIGEDSFIVPSFIRFTDKKLEDISALL
ncbi:MAG: hypothetical protein Q7S61_02735 [bacterium]|nr:hypothetical protein [bacterium]